MEEELKGMQVQIDKEMLNDIIRIVKNNNRKVKRCERITLFLLIVMLINLIIRIFLMVF